MFRFSGNMPVQPSPALQGLQDRDWGDGKVVHTDADGVGDGVDDSGERRNDVVSPISEHLQPGR